MKKRVKGALSVILIVFLIILTLLAIIFLIRLTTPNEIDDVTPGIPCPEIERYNPEILYVIPNYNNNPISENLGWCDYILSLNKTLGLHGLTHTYREFLYKNITQEELNLGVSEFEFCFGFRTETFKPPQLKISEENKKLIEENNLKRRTIFQQITHKVYHCNDSDIISNRFVHIF